MIWTERWVKSARLPKRLYTLPNGNIGRKYVDLLTNELKLLSTTADSTSERVLVMGRVLLQRDPMIKASKDIRTLIGRRIEDWKENKFDKLLAEAVRCGKKKSRYFGRQTCLESVCFINDERQSENCYAVALGESKRGCA